jgi:predicted DNA binding protein
VAVHRRGRRVKLTDTGMETLLHRLVAADTRGELERVTCEEFAESDRVQLAWIGGRDPETNGVTPRTVVGASDGYLADVPLTPVTDTPSESTAQPGLSRAEPAVVAADSHQTVLVEDTEATEHTAVEQTREPPWVEHARRHGIRSIVSFPLVYDDSLQGVLSVCADEPHVFDDAFTETGSILADLLANGLVAVRRTRSLQSRPRVELEFGVDSRDCSLLELARAADGPVELRDIVPSGDGPPEAVVQVAESDQSAFLEAARDLSVVESVQRLEDDDPTIRLQFTRPFGASTLAKHGLVVREMTANTANCRVCVGVPSTMDTWTALDAVTTTYDGAELLAKRRRSGDGESGLSTDVLDRLTPRQREVVETAYREGYFDSPRGASSEELAAELGFSTSAFHRHVRIVERELFDEMFGKK